MKKEKTLSFEESLTPRYGGHNFITEKVVNNFNKAALSLANSIETKKILEIGFGIGSGGLVEKLKYKKYEASEYNPEFLKQAKEKYPNLSLKQESVYDLKRQDDSFDLIILLEVLEHLDDFHKALREMKRVTRKYCLISVPREPTWRALNLLRGLYIKDWGNTPGHINHWSKKSFIKLISKYFDIAEIKTPLPWIVVLAKKR